MIYGDFSHEMLPINSLLELKDIVILQGTISESSINPDNNCADITYGTPTTEFSYIISTAVPFFYHCEDSTGTVEDLAEGYKAFADGDSVIICHYPGSTQETSWTYIIGHADISDIRMCSPELIVISSSADARTWITIFDPKTNAKYVDPEGATFPFQTYGTGAESAEDIAALEDRFYYTYNSPTSEDSWCTVVGNPTSLSWYPWTHRIYSVYANESYWTIAQTVPDPDPRPEDTFVSYYPWTVMESTRAEDFPYDEWHITINQRSSFVNDIDVTNLPIISTSQLWGKSGHYYSTEDGVWSAIIPLNHDYSDFYAQRVYDVNDMPVAISSGFGGDVAVVARGARNSDRYINYHYHHFGSVEFLKGSIVDGTYHRMMDHHVGVTYYPGDPEWDTNYSSLFYGTFQNEIRTPVTTTASLTPGQAYDSGVTNYPSTSPSGVATGAYTREGWSPYQSRTFTITAPWQETAFVTEELFEGNYNKIDYDDANGYTHTDYEWWRSDTLYQMDQNSPIKPLGDGIIIWPGITGIYAVAYANFLFGGYDYDTDTDITTFSSADIEVNFVSAGGSYGNIPNFSGIGNLSITDIGLLPENSAFQSVISELLNHVRSEIVTKTFSNYTEYGTFINQGFTLAIYGIREK